MENPDEEFDVEKEWPEVRQEEYDGNPSGYRELCWDLKVCSIYNIIYMLFDSDLKSYTFSNQMS